MSGVQTRSGLKSATKSSTEEEMSKNPDIQRQEEDGDEREANKLATATREYSSIRSELSEDLRSFKKDIRDAFLDMKADMTKTLKEELAAFKKDINDKLTEHAATLASHDKAIVGIQERIEEVEASGPITKDALLDLLKEQRQLREKVTDLEGRSKRNNVRIYGIPENAEGDSVIKFVSNLLTTELPLPEGMSLQIQRAHRSLIQKPGTGSPPRSIIVNFLQYEVKETVLRLAWRKKITLNDKQIYFDQDYAREVIEKRKSYGEIKKVLQRQGIRFQTPFTRIRIHWSDGSRIYNDAEDAAKEIRARGIEVTVPRVRHTARMEERIIAAFPWEEARSDRRGSSMERRVKQKLAEFRSGQKPQRLGSV